ncbi:MAG TPA: Ig-like domain-containing protein, partial [Syntrophobacter fumaroxidans]|nr:Ig-like domain-containing protein [Syntrophobacter fumaroxidans]
ITLTGTDADGDTLSFTVTSSPAHGTLSGTAPNLTYTPAAGYHGPDAFEFKVNDGKADSAAATVSITVNAVNHLPAAADDSASTEAGKVVDIAVLANDTDPDGDTLLVSGFTQGANGSVSGGANNVLVYSPNAGFSGEDGFTYIVDDGNGGSASATVTVAVRALAGISLEITSPLDGDFVVKHSTLVIGTVVNSAGNETGVVVNGVPAVVIGTQFVANRVRLQNGTNTLTAVATDTQGNTATTSIAVNSDTTGGYLELSTVIHSGISPFETSLSIGGTFPCSDAVLTYTGPGEAEFLQSTQPEDRVVRLVAEGLYLFTAEAADDQGTMHTDTVALVVFNRDDLDALFKSKWNAMKGKLSAGAIEDALGYFRERSKERYRTIFTALAAGLPGIVSGMQEIEMILCRESTAEYRIPRVHMVDGEAVTITYSIFFRVDEDGLWKIDRF